MRNNPKEYKEYLIGDLFKIRRGKRIVRNVDYITNKNKRYIYPVITSTTQNNGVDGYYSNKNCNANSLVCGGEASGMYTTYQPYDCWVMDRARIFTPTEGTIINEYTGIYLATVFNLNQYRYSYGRSANPDEIENLTIILPCQSNGTPDFEYMQNYIKALKHKPITTNITMKPNDIDVANWLEYRLDDLFKFVKGKRLTKEDMVDGPINYLGAISENNGIRDHIQADKSCINNSNCITVNYNGSVGEAFYQHDPFWASDDVNILYAKNWDMNKYNAIFIITIIKANRYRFSYGRKWTLEKMKESIIKLPAKDNGQPDFKYMEEYIKSLSYSDRI